MGEVSASLAASVGTSMTRSSSFSSSRSTTVTRTFTATPHGHCLWQWVFDYNRGGRQVGQTYTERFAQTAGEWEPPACLPGYSSDQMNGAQTCARSAARIRNR